MRLERIDQRNDSRAVKTQRIGDGPLRRPGAAGHYGENRVVTCIKTEGCQLSVGLAPRRVSDTSQQIRETAVKRTRRQSAGDPGSGLVCRIVNHLCFNISSA